MKRTVILVDPTQRATAHAYIDDVPAGWVMTPSKVELPRHDGVGRCVTSPMRQLLGSLSAETCSSNDALRIAIAVSDSKVQATALLNRATKLGYIHRVVLLTPKGEEVVRRAREGL